MTGLFPRAARSPVCDGEMPSFTAHRRRGVAHRRVGRSSVGARADVARVLPHVAAPRGRWTVVARSPRCPSPANPPVRPGYPHPHGTNPTRMDDGPFTAAHGLVLPVWGSRHLYASTPTFRGHVGDDRHVRARGTRWSCQGVRGEPSTTPVELSRPMPPTAECGAGQIWRRARCVVCRGCF